MSKVLYGQATSFSYEAIKAGRHFYQSEVGFGIVKLVNNGDYQPSDIGTVEVEFCDLEGVPPLYPAGDMLFPTHQFQDAGIAVDKIHKAIDMIRIR